LTPLPYTLTIPPPDDYYFVREDQLDGLTQDSKDWSIEIALAAGSGAVGLFQNLWNISKDVYHSQAIATTDLVLGAFAIGLGVLAIAKYIQAKRGESSVEALKNKIKSGQKAAVR
jgi:hypothetical protein